MKDKSKFHKWGLIALTVIVISSLLFFQLKWGVWIFYRINNSIREGAIYNEWHYTMVITDNIHNLYWEHAGRLLEIEKTIITDTISQIDLNDLKELPGVLDVFYLNLQQQTVMHVNKEIPIDSILKSSEWEKKTGGTNGSSRRKLGGLTRFKKIKDYSLFVRPIGIYDPAVPKEVIGYVLDKEWLLSRLPERLDSLGRNSINLTLFAPYVSDSMRSLQDDPYICPGGWKQTIGVVHGKDTLWWSGDPIEKIEFGAGFFQTGYVWDMEEFDIKIFAKHSKPDWDNEIVSDSKRLLYTFIGIDIIAFLLLFFLYKTIRLHRKQASRNQIALAHLAHSIKTPVARIRLDTDSLIEEMVASPAEEREIITAIGRECGRMERAVQSAALSMEEGKHTLNLESCDLAQIVSDTTLAWQTQFDQAGIRLTLNKGDVSLSGRFDREMIAVMIDNLLDNALRHTMLNSDNIRKGEAGVTVQLQKVDGTGEIIVDDMGGGIPKSERKHIFKRFRRISGDAATGVTGLGLGLALVKEITESHGGKVHVTDNDSGGARFVVELSIS
ncbi:HAMP domain-containing histidine kinase [bacterium]|nr:HAMP domain-containing histidine kinase [bacterium]